MKIRTDYVSNSSSSSFVIVLDKGYDYRQFIKDIVESCAMNPEFNGDDKEWLEGLKEDNRINLEYCLKTHELLFLGCLEPDDGDKGLPIEGTTVTRSTMEYRMMRSPYRKQDTGDDRKERVAAIVDYARIADREWYVGGSSGIYEITMNTIKNTEDLIAEGKKVVLEDWCSDIGKLKKMLEDGDRIFGIHMAQGGDGQGNTNVYAVSGWDSDINHYANAQILHCELC